MFDEFESRSAAALLAEMSTSLRAERRYVARRVVAAGVLCRHRIAESGEDEVQWCIDNWEAVAAEVAAELGISRGRASSHMGYGYRLIERMPKLTEVFLAGEIDFFVVIAVDFRTGLITDPNVLAEIDRQVAEQAPLWNRKSREKVSELVDWLVIQLDPEAVRVSKQRDTDRHIEVRPDQSGMAEIWGVVRGADALAFDRRLDELAATVCADDPRTKRQRRADALTPLADGCPSMGCACGRPDCNTVVQQGPKRSTVLFMVADESTVQGDGAKPGYQPGIGAVPGHTVAELAKSADVKRLCHPADLRAEPRHRPSVALTNFIRCRDMTCRWPGCEVPAEHCDIDHTVPYPVGPTHPSNCKLLCRPHHLLKTFYSGEGGWHEVQFPNGTIRFTSPSGRVYETRPTGALLFPQLAVPTERLIVEAGQPPPRASRSLAMPMRRRSRAQDRAYRIEWERNVNRRRIAADPPPF